MMSKHNLASTKNKVKSLNFDALPDALRAATTCAPWRYVIEGERQAKRLVNGEGRVVRWQREPLMSAREACEVAQAQGGGVGVVLRQSSLFAVDIDGVRDPATGKIESWAREIVEAIPTYWESSPSGRGLRAFVHANIGDYFNQKTVVNGHSIEIANAGKWFSITGAHINGTPMQVADCTAAMKALIARLFPPKPSLNMQKSTGVSRHSDADILERMPRTFVDKNDTSPSGTDFAAICWLMRTTNGDIDQIERVLWQSALVRPKWHANPEYVARSIAAAYATFRPAVRQESPIAAQSDALDAWTLQAKFAEYVPTHLQSKRGYRTRSSDKSLAAGLSKAWRRAGSFDVLLSYADLANLSGLSKGTIGTALKRLEGWFVTVTPVEDAEAWEAQNRFSLGESTRSNLNAIVSFTVLPSGGAAKLYRQSVGGNPFIRGHSRVMRLFDGEKIASIGESGLSVIAALQSGAETAKEVAAAVAMPDSSARKVLNRLVELDIAEVEQYGRVRRFALFAHWQRVVTDLEPTMRTHLLTQERSDKRCVEALGYWTWQAEIAGTPEEKAIADNKIAAAVERRKPVLRQLYPDATSEEIAAMAAQPATRYQRRRYVEAHTEIVIEPTIEESPVANSEPPVIDARHAEEKRHSDAMRRLGEVIAAKRREFGIDVKPSYIRHNVAYCEGERYDRDDKPNLLVTVRNGDVRRSPRRLGDVYNGIFPAAAVGAGSAAER